MILRRLAEGLPRAALEAFETPSDQLDERFRIDLYQASQEHNLSIRRATYNELVSTGRIEYLVYPVTHLVTYSECLRGQMQGAIAPA